MPKHEISTSYDAINEYKNYEVGKKYYLRLSFNLKILNTKFIFFGNNTFIAILLKRIGELSQKFDLGTGVFKYVSVEEGKDYVEIVFEKIGE